MKRTIIAIGLAVLAVSSFAQGLQVTDAEEWLRSRPYQESARDAG
jgi:hypothetical protein